MDRRADAPPGDCSPPPTTPKRHEMARPLLCRCVAARLICCFGAPKQVRLAKPDGANSLGEKTRESPCTLKILECSQNPNSKFQFEALVLSSTGLSQGSPSTRPAC